MVVQARCCAAMMRDMVCLCAGAARAARGEDAHARNAATCRQRARDEEIGHGRLYRARMTEARVDSACTLRKRMRFPSAMTRRDEDGSACRSRR